ncbi:MAG TPA: hypothetical protein VFZ03_05630 [Dongiaceae bacterium]|jgi:hypothetical protein
MTAMVFDLARARRARSNGERSLIHPWTPRLGPAEVEDFRVGDKVLFRDGKIGTILCFGTGGMRGPLMALVTVNGLNYTCPVSDLRSAC